MLPLDPPLHIYTVRFLYIASLNSDAGSYNGVICPHKSGGDQPLPPSSILPLSFFLLFPFSLPFPSSIPSLPLNTNLACFVHYLIRSLEDNKAHVYILFQNYQYVDDIEITIELKKSLVNHWHPTSDLQNSKGPKSDGDRTPPSQYNVTSVEGGKPETAFRYAPASRLTVALLFSSFRYRIGGLANAPWTTVRVVSNDVTSVIIHQLTPNTFYDVMVLSRNRIGDALFSNIVSAKTKS